MSISSVTDIERARRAARELLTELGFSSNQNECVVLAVSELTMNLVRYGQDGDLILGEVRDSNRIGIQVEARDHGPGIVDLLEAMQDGFSTGGGLGSGLPAVRRLMDEFEFASSPSGTNIVTRKWLNNK